MVNPGYDYIIAAQVGGWWSRTGSRPTRPAASCCWRPEAATAISVKLSRWILPTIYNQRFSRLFGPNRTRHGGRSIVWPAGRVLGGSSSINGFDLHSRPA